MTSEVVELIKQHEMNCGAEETSMKASASTLHGWEMDQLFKLRERQPHLIEQGITEEDIDAENVAVRQIVTCTLPGDMI